MFFPYPSSFMEHLEGQGEYFSQEKHQKVLCPSENKNGVNLTIAK